MPRHPRHNVATFGTTTSHRQAAPTVAPAPAERKAVSDLTREEWETEILEMFAGHEDLLKLEVPTFEEMRAMKKRGES